MLHHRHFARGWFRAALPAIAVAAALSALPPLPARATAAGAPAAKEAPAGLLDGWVFVVHLRDAQGKHEQEDSLLFRSGRFESSECRQHKFDTPPYTGTLGSKNAAFTAKASSPTDGTTLWKGTLEGGLLKGTMTWTNLAGDVTEYRLDGKPVMGPLDDAMLSVEITHADGKKEGPDSLVFRASTFESMGCRPYNFKEALYTAVNLPEGVRFDATTSSPTDGTILWMGTIHGKSVEGTMTWTNKAGKTSTASFKGARIGAGA